MRSWWLDVEEDGIARSLARTAASAFSPGCVAAHLVDVQFVAHAVLSG
jgi:hypothetical protein